MSGPKTEIFSTRLVSLNGGYSFKSPLALTQAEYDKHWSDLIAKMDPALRQQVEGELPGGDRRVLLARYLELSPSHLVVG